MKSGGAASGGGQQGKQGSRIVLIKLTFIRSYFNTRKKQEIEKKEAILPSRLGKTTPHLKPPTAPDEGARAVARSKRACCLGQQPPLPQAATPRKRGKMAENGDKNHAFQGTKPSAVPQPADRQPIAKTPKNSAISAEKSPDPKSGSFSPLFCLHIATVFNRTKAFLTFTPAWTVSGRARRRTLI